MIIAAYGPKGGAGKTTTAVNVAAVLATAGRSVLVIDLEADLNASISLGVRPTEAHPSIADVLLNDVRGDDAVREVAGVPNLSLITGSPDLAFMDDRLRNVRQPERRLADVVRPFTARFDVIVIDGPAPYSRLGLGLLLAADELIVPIRAEYLSLESLAQFLRWYRDRRNEHGLLAPIAGILLTMIDYRRHATREIVDIIRAHNRHGVFETEIPPDPRVSEAPSHGIPFVLYSSASRASRAYGQLCAEVLARGPQRGRR